MAHVTQKNINPQLFAFLKQEKMTDVTLTAEGKMIKAHKLMLAAASGYFEVRNRNINLVKIIIYTTCNNFIGTFHDIGRETSSYRTERHKYEAPLAYSRVHILWICRLGS